MGVEEGFARVWMGDDASTGMYLNCVQKMMPHKKLGTTIFGV